MSWFAGGGTPPLQINLFDERAHTDLAKPISCALYGVTLVRYVISSGEEADKSEFEGFKQVLLQPTLKAVKTMALPLGELARSD